jgi:hypothetical protein
MLGELYRTVIQVLIFVRSLYEEESMNNSIIFFFGCLPISLEPLNAV